MTDQEWPNRVAVVTGGSDGLGFDFCRALVERGCRVYFCARNEERGLRAAEATGAHFFQADLSIPAEVTAFADHIRQTEGRVDYLVNNVANDDRIPFGNVTPDECDRMWQVNLRSYLLTTHACLDLLQAGEGKSVVNIGTTNYMMGFVEMTLYNAAKSGIVGFTRSLGRELGPEGIRVNMVSPGWIMTSKQLKQYVTPEDKKALLQEQSLKFLLEPKHVTPVVLFLLSSDGVGMTGQNLVVDGGKILQ
ncbi:MAG: SDR family oxidoreductase [Armatimonadota bacterium]|nr:SDR family oxidoreductase [Armatimonadota bacterium]